MTTPAASMQGHRVFALFDTPFFNLGAYLCRDRVPAPETAAA